MAKLIPIIAVPRSIMEQFLKSTQGMVQRRTWVKDTAGRSGHYRMQWVSPFDAGRGTADHSKQFDLFGEPEPFEKPATKPSKKADAGEPQKSKGHLGFFTAGGRRKELLEHWGGDIYTAELDDVIDVRTGDRIGRWEGPSWQKDAILTRFGLKAKEAPQEATEEPAAEMAPEWARLKEGLKFKSGDEVYTVHFERGEVRAIDSKGEMKAGMNYKKADEKLTIADLRTFFTLPEGGEKEPEKPAEPEKKAETSGDDFREALKRQAVKTNKQLFGYDPDEEKAEKDYQSTKNVLDGHLKRINRQAENLKQHAEEKKRGEKGMSLRDRKYDKEKADEARETMRWYRKNWPDQYERWAKESGADPIAAGGKITAEQAKSSSKWEKRKGSGEFILKFPSPEDGAEMVYSTVYRGDYGPGSAPVYFTHDDAKFDSLAEAKKHAWETDALPRLIEDGWVEAPESAEPQTPADKPTEPEKPSEKPVKEEKAKDGDYKIYHDEFYKVVDEVIAYLDKKGLYLTKEDLFTKISTGPGKPKDGRTDRYSIPLFDSEGKPAGKAVNFQVYDMDGKKYELNMYVSPMKKAEYENLYNTKYEPIHNPNSPDPTIGEQYARRGAVRAKGDGAFVVYFDKDGKQMGTKKIGSASEARDEAEMFNRDYADKSPAMKKSILASFREGLSKALGGR